MKSCKECGKGFTPAKFNPTSQKFCSVECRTKVQNRRRSDYKKKWTEENKERAAIVKKKWLLENPDRRREISERYRKAHKEYYCFKAIEYYHKKNRSKPVWADDELMELIYLECPEGCEVDHVIPTNSPIVCGLHTHENLQYLPMPLNRRKSNHFNEEVLSYRRY